MSIEASKYTKSATVERAREMLKRLHDRNQRTWDDLDRDVAFAIEALIASAERYRFIANKMQAEQAQVQHDYRTRYDRGCYKCGSHYCPADCPKPAHLVRQQPQQEPVAWQWKERINGDFDSWVISVSEPPPYAIEKQPLYTSSPQRQPLTDEEIALIAAACGGLASDFVVDVARAIEAAHGIRNDDAA